MTVTPLEGVQLETHLGATAAKWISVGLSTAPADREAAAEAVRTAYQSADLAPPKRIVWFDSPLAGARAAALLTGRRGLPGQHTASTDDIAELLRAQDCPPTPGTAGVSVRSAVRTRPWAAAREQVHAALGPDGWARLWTACGADVWRTVNDRVAAPLRSHLRSELPRYFDGQPPTGPLLDAVGGQHDAGWLAAFDAAHEASPTVVRAAQQLAGLGGVARSAGWWWTYAEVAILTERPATLRRDNIGRLHAADGPALAYRDGYGLHAWRGLAIPSDTVVELSNLTQERISTESNAELRRVMLEHYGYERYLRDDVALVMVEVVNSTPEPDGTSRTYWLRVPPTTRTAREGVAWTFGLTEEEYRPLVET
jgi:hypothetical protein